MGGEEGPDGEAARGFARGLWANVVSKKCKGWVGTHAEKVRLYATLSRLIAGTYKFVPVICPYVVLRRHVADTSCSHMLELHQP